MIAITPEPTKRAIKEAENGIGREALHAQSEPEKFIEKMLKASLFITFDINFCDKKLFSEFLTKEFPVLLRHTSAVQDAKWFSSSIGKKTTLALGITFLVNMFLLSVTNSTLPHEYLQTALGLILILTDLYIVLIFLVVRKLFSKTK